ncbi:hypothetical protein SLI_4228 [Streptomyces lividans 1326]|uniref:Uncharacterized protein n=1 Tax=Streptomyces lividans 1326 TaxID=1200984 RepID=A0A7U9HCB0_STRLI|nr:hypothetical protein SLI_4228 [Streptomyces lividans 1326]
MILYAISFSHGPSEHHKRLLWVPDCPLHRSSKTKRTHCPFRRWHVYPPAVAP